MQILIDWIEDKKTSTFVLTGLVLLSYATLIFFPKFSFVVYASFFVSVLVPFAIFLVWTVDSYWIKKLLQRRWTAILITGVFVTYGMFANTFASDVINGYFRVDPVHFTVTSIFLTTIYIFIGVFQPLIMLPIWFVLIVAGSIIIPALIVIGSITQSVIRIGIFFLAAVLISVSTQMLGLLEQQLPQLAEWVALNADFNENHRCTAKWEKQIDKVVFLNDGNVLGHVAGTRDYLILPCIPK